MRVPAGRILAVLAVALLALGLMLAPPAAADQCAPPGVDSASALPTNLAAAAKGPAEDKYTTPNVEPLDSVDLDALGSRHAGHPDSRHAVGRPAEHLHQRAGPVHRLRQRTAARRRRQARPAESTSSAPTSPACWHRWPSRRSTSARPRSPPPTRAGRPSASPMATTSATSRWSFRPARRSPASTTGRRPAHRRGAGHRPGGLRRRHPAPGPGEVPGLQHASTPASRPARSTRGWRRRSRRVGTVQAGRPRRDRRKHLQPGQFRRVGGRQGEQAADRRAQLRPRRGHRRRHLVQAVLRLGAARAPARLEARIQGRAGAGAPRLRRDRRRAAPQPITSGGRGEIDTARSCKDSFLDWDLYKQAIPDLFKTGLPNTLILTVCASIIGLALGLPLAVAGISRARWLRWPARVYTDIFRGLPEVVIILLIGLGIGPIVGGLTGNNPYPLGSRPWG